MMRNGFKMREVFELLDINRVFVFYYDCVVFFLTEGILFRIVMSFDKILI